MRARRSPPLVLPASAVHHPRAWRLLNTMRAWIGYVFTGLVAVGAWSMLLFMLGAFDEMTMMVPGFLLVVCVVTFFAGSLVYVLTVTLFFARFSLGQMVAALLFFGTCVSLVVTLGVDDGFYFLILMGSALLGIAVAIMRQDPCGENEQPHFIQRERAHRVIEKIRLRREREADASRSARRIAEGDAAHA